MKIKRRRLIRLIHEALAQQEVEQLTLASNDNERKKVYRALLLKHHPDRGGELENAQQLTNLFSSLEDGSYEPEPQQKQQRPKSRFEKWVDYFSSFKSTTDEIFSSTNDRELLKSYGNILLDYYSRKNKKNDAYLAYNNTAIIVDNVDVSFDEQLISNLGFNDDYVRWKFRSMMYAKKAVELKDIKEVLIHVQRSVIEMEKVLNPGRGTSRQQWFIYEIYKSLIENDKKRGRTLLDKIASENKLVFSQYNLYNTVLALMN